MNSRQAGGGGETKRQSKIPFLKPLLLAISKFARSREVVLIGIDGAGGAGKTSLAEYLRNRLKNCAIVQLYDFYSPALQMADLLRLKEQVLAPLHNQREASYQIYDWKAERLSDWHTLKPEVVVIIEGVYALDQTLREYYDLKVWIEIPADVGMERGVGRDIARDGVDNSDLRKDIWMPLEEKYRNKQKPGQCADFVLDGTQ